ncbi:MAG: GGDEF domain-containing protein [Acidobacteriota bacterium]
MSSSEASAAAPRDHGAGRLAAIAVPGALLALALLLALGSPTLAPGGLWANPWELLAWVAVGALAALHRPFAPAPRPLAARSASSSTLGLGALVVPAVSLRLGAVPAAVAASLVLVGSVLLRRAAARRLGESRRVATMSAARTLERAFAVAAAAFIAAGASAFGFGGVGGVWSVLGPALLNGLALLVILVGIEGLRGERRAPHLLAGPVVVDVAGWTVGSALAGLAPSVGWAALAPIYGAFALVAAEAARQALLRHHSDDAVGNYRRLQEAHERILAESGGMGGIAQQILTECRNLLPVEWFHFELPPDGDAARSWAAGPDGRLIEGRPAPAARPRMLPGIHRRASWRRIERQLLGSAAGEDAAQLATLRLWLDPRKIETGAEERFENMVPLMASSVHRASLDREARLDPLTGVPVRRVLEARMQKAYDLACTEGQPMAIVMVDIDHFKSVNDTWGHAAGDAALQLVARTLDHTRRDDDLCCRYGGEEFTVLLERTDGASALSLAERLRAAVAALEFDWEGQRIPLTASFGVASFPEVTIRTAGELLLLADEALYRAKEEGRDRAVLHRGAGRFETAPRRPAAQRAAGSAKGASSPGDTLSA